MKEITKAQAMDLLKVPGTWIRFEFFSDPSLLGSPILFLNYANIGGDIFCEGSSGLKGWSSLKNIEASSVDKGDRWFDMYDE